MVLIDSTILAKDLHYFNGHLMKGKSLMRTVDCMGLSLIFNLSKYVVTNQYSNLQLNSSKFKIFLSLIDKRQTTKQTNFDFINNHFVGKFRDISEKSGYIFLQKRNKNAIKFPF